MTPLGCRVSGLHGPLQTERLKLELANHSPWYGMFYMVEMHPGQTPTDLMADPAAPWPNFRRAAESTTKAWWSSKEVAYDRWAVTCWKHRASAASPNAFSFTPFDAVAIRSR